MSSACQASLSNGSKAWGWAYVDGAFRPFVKYREITRGRRVGKFEIIVGGRKVVVSRDVIRRFPHGA